MFGPDGMLYLGFGDGGSQNDPNGNGQSFNRLLGKLLRIDLNGRDVNNAYSIPERNLVAPNARGEIWAYGLRNPWRFSFDACNGDLYWATSGRTHRKRSTICRQYRGRHELRLENHGGPRSADPERPAVRARPLGFTLPVDAYPRDIGTSVTGGYVYRGSDVPGCGAHTSTRTTTARASFASESRAARPWTKSRSRISWGKDVDNISSFGQDNAGEVYVATLTPGAVYRIAAAQ